MTPCEVVTFVNALVCAIGNCEEDTEQLAILAAIFVQLGDSLATYITYKDTCCTSNKDEGINATPGTNTTFIQ